MFFARFSVDAGTDDLADAPPRATAARLKLEPSARRATVRAADGCGASRAAAWDARKARSTVRRIMVDDVAAEHALKIEQHRLL